ncbi:uncharacterized protein METZ01_LOCUS348739 [marine metagenome]|uniref:DUF4178 domain-containing protein n=1 Tax=marine metagenome TaxID=408172 RepID=A0A382RFC8_9ZZZZ
MGIKKWFGEGDDDTEHAYVEHTLATMQTGFLVDYDLKTWQVTGCGTHDYDGYLTKEWEIQADGVVNFLECAVEDGLAEWTLSQAIDPGEIEGDIMAAIIENEDPPETIRYSGKQYEGTQSSAGLYRKDGEGEGREFVSWSFESTEGRVLYLSQWGERDFAAYEGEAVEEYQFTDILPIAEDS